MILNTIGKHEIDIRIKNQSIQNSPFIFNVLKSRDPKSISNHPIFTFGSEGSNDGQFFFPRGICINSKGEIIVADCANHRIQIFDKDGKFICKFGSTGKANGQFFWPKAVVINQQDNIYISGSGNDRIQIFNADGSIHLLTIGLKGSNDGQFNNPYGICIDSDNNNILVADRGNHRIQIFDKDGKFIRKFCKQGCGAGELDHPTGIVLNSKKEIVVSEYANHRLQVFDYQGNHLRFIGMGNLQNPYHLCLDEQDNIFIRNLKRNAEISVFSSITGELIHSFGKGFLNEPQGIAFDPISQRIFVANTDSHNICVF